MESRNHHGSSKFFRSRVLNSPPAEILEFVKKLEKEAEEIKKDLLKLCWFMRGGLTYQESLYLSWDERKMIGEIIKENLETTKKSGLPFF